MQVIEVTGKSVDEAKKNAAAKLGVEEGQITVEVIEETKGLFGKSNVRIRAEVKSAPAAKAAPKAAKAPQPAEEPMKAVQESFEEAPAEEAPAKKPRGRVKKAEAPAPEAPQAAAGSAPAPQRGEEGEGSGPAATQADADQLAGLVRELVQSGDLEVTVKGTELNGRYVNVELDGRDVAHLVGKHGEVLNAMQYLVNIIAGRKFNNGIRATLDGNNYRQRREEALYNLATRVADEVKNRGEEAVLDALPAFERRIIHKSLSDYQGVQTYSEGEEPNRRVVIAPAE